MTLKIGVIGLGYVGLPLALAFAKKFPGTVGFDIHEKKISQLNSGIDPNDEGFDNEVKETSLLMSSCLEDLRGVNFFVIAVPTPVDINNNPNFSPLEGASHTVAKVLSKDSIVVFESTVYPGVTESICGPMIAKFSGLRQGIDFKLGYSPERMNPGDKEHSLERVVKVVSGEDAATAETVASVYGAVVTAGVYSASSIKVAEAAKVIENTQRDLNIALMNELAIIFDRMNINTNDVLDAAATKWNFLRFSPGLVGGHCIGVDPYYLTTAAQQLGYHPQVILAGRRINDGMGVFVAQKMVKLLIQKGQTVKGAKIGVFGLTFKENVSDVRNSRVPDIVKELREFGIEPLVYDPLAESELAHEEYGIELVSESVMRGLDGVIMAVAHNQFKQIPIKMLCETILKTNGIIVDVKSVVKRANVPPTTHYWAL